VSPGRGQGIHKSADREPDLSSRAGWCSRRQEKARRLARVEKLARGRVLPTGEIVPALEELVASGDRVALEGNNQKQADFLSRSLAAVNPEKVHDLHMLISSISRPEQLDLFERDIAEKVDFSYAGPQSLRVAQLLADGKLRVGAIHTYLELYGRLFVDLVPTVALVAAEAADAEGNLYTGANTEDTPTIVEATAFRGGIVIAQVNELVDELPRVDVPGSWIDFVVEADKPYAVEPLFTRDPRQITDFIADCSEVDSCDLLFVMPHPQRRSLSSQKVLANKRYAPTTRPWVNLTARCCRVA
jgi:malonate decarboxylase alpha subunit